MTCVLVAEDEPLVRASLMESLRMQKYEVYGARDGETAIDFIDNKTFDAVIADYLMTGRLTGLDVLNHFHLRYHGRVKVLITGKPGSDTQRQVEQIGGIFVLKPFALEQLIDVVDSLLTH
jgi:DNA-binding NtrC family response regulator